MPHVRSPRAHASFLVPILLSLALTALNVGAKAASVGVVDDPCAEVPLQPTAAHRATADWYASWMKDWLVLDWAQRCRYRQENAQLPPTSPARIVFMGDSITEGWKPAAPAFFREDWLDRGISGQTTDQMVVRFRADVIDLHPAAVHIMGGTNDVAGNRGPTSLAQIESNIEAMVEQARRAKIVVVIASVPPAAAFGWSPVQHVPQTIRALNQWLQAYAEREHLVYADYYAALADEQGGMRREFSEDGVHPNAAGYAVMQPIAEQALAAARLVAKKNH
jgi:hypothetical protein